MMRRSIAALFGVIGICSVLFSCTKKHEAAATTSKATLTDAANRSVSVPATVQHVICSGAGCLRYLVYLQALDKVVAVDDVEKKRSSFDARPYALAHPELMKLPLFGEFRGFDNPELIAALQPSPDLIFKTYGQMGHDPSELQEKTGIPVFVLDYGDLTKGRAAFDASLRTMGKILNRSERAEEIIEYVDAAITDLDKRTRGVPVRKRAYVGGVAYKGPLGLQSTEPAYPPFVFTHADNVAFDPAKLEMPHLDVAKEQIVEWDPDVLFIDLATLQSDPSANALHELKTDSAYSKLQALKSKEVFGALPYNWYGQNYESTLANAYYIGKVLHPDRFQDVDPEKKADEIFAFMVGSPVFQTINREFGGLVFKRLE